MAEDSKIKALEKRIEELEKKFEESDSKCNIEGKEVAGNSSRGISRRQFLKKAGFGTAGLAALMSPVSAQYFIKDDSFTVQTSDDNGDTLTNGLFVDENQNVDVPNGFLNEQGSRIATRNWSNNNFNDYTDSEAVSAVDSQVSDAASTITGLDSQVDSNQLNIENLESHGNENHSETYAVDGDTQPPENHGNESHTETFATTNNNIENFSTNGNSDTIPVSQGDGTLSMEALEAGGENKIRIFRSDGGGADDLGEKDFIWFDQNLDIEELDGTDEGDGVQVNSQKVDVDIQGDSSAEDVDNLSFSNDFTELNIESIGSNTIFGVKTLIRLLEFQDSSDLPDTTDDFEPLDAPAIAYLRDEEDYVAAVGDTWVSLIDGTTYST